MHELEFSKLKRKMRALYFHVPPAKYVGGGVRAVEGTHVFEFDVVFFCIWAAGDFLPYRKRSLKNRAARVLEVEAEDARFGSAGRWLAAAW